MAVLKKRAKSSPSDLMTTFEESLGQRDKYSELFLPKNEDGEVNYQVLGNVLASKALEDHWCASFVDPKYGRKLTEGVEGIPDTEWKFVSEKDGLVTLKKYNEKTRINCFMGRILVNALMPRVARFIRELRTRYQYDPMCIKIEEVEQISEKDSIIYLEHQVEKLWGLFKIRRDSCSLIRRDTIDGKFVQTSMSIEHPKYPEKPDVIRMEYLPGTGWVLEPYHSDPTKTIITYLANLNLRGTTPRILVNAVLQKQPRCLLTIRRILETQKISQNSVDSTSVNFLSREDSDKEKDSQYQPNFSDTFNYHSNYREEALALATNSKEDLPNATNNGKSTESDEQYDGSLSNPNLLKHHGTWLWGNPPPQNDSKPRSESMPTVSTSQQDTENSSLHGCDSSSNEPEEDTRMQCKSNCNPNSTLSFKSHMKEKQEDVDN